MIAIFPFKTRSLRLIREKQKIIIQTEKMDRAQRRHLLRPWGGRVRMDSELKELRFWARVRRLKSGCWVWTGPKKQSRGKVLYGKYHNGKEDVAHRTAWILTFGKIPKDIKVLHACDNPPCCNPAHLFLGTQMDNIRDMISKGRDNFSGLKCRK